MPRWSRQEQHGVRKDSLNLPRFYSRIQVQFSFLPRSAFCSFTLCILRQFLFSQSRFLVRRFTIFYFCEVLYCFFRDILFLAVFKMGVKMFRPFTIFPCSPRFSSFVASQYLWIHRNAIFCYFTIFLNPPRCHLLLRHDISESTAMPSFVAPRYFWIHRDAIFCCATIFLNSLRCHLLLRHDISEFTAMPSFVAPRYFWIHRDAIILLLHDISESTAMPYFCCTTIFLMCTTPFDLQISNTALSCAAISSTVFKNYATLAASRPARC